MGVDAGILQSLAGGLPFSDRSVDDGHYGGLARRIDALANGSTRTNLPTA